MSREDDADSEDTVEVTSAAESEFKRLIDRLKAEEKKAKEDSAPQSK